MGEKSLSGPLTLKLDKDEIICSAGEHDHDLYIIHKGKLLVFVNNGTKITPLAFLGPGEYIGELSFFDKEPRSAHVICVEPSTLIRIPVTEKEKQFPRWLETIAISITHKLRKTGELVRQKGIRKQNVETMKPLTIEEQRHYYQKLQDYMADNA
ncbi:MAG: cyclic nucleotide-binding domain-containing protein [Oligoflexia bacterium]|nr:cyclic nucleotide-binding domain-containing protein [Oligoflexia bacterium]